MVVLLGVLTVVAVLPLGPMRWQGAGLVVSLVPIVTGFAVGQLFRAAEDDGSASVGAVLVAVALAAVSVGVFVRWRRSAGARADADR